MTIGLHVHRPASYNSSAMPRLSCLLVVQLLAFVDKFDHVYKQRVTFQS